MLPVLLVLFVATSAFAAPMVTLDQYENYVGDNTYSALAFNVLDDGDTNVYMLNAKEILNDLARTPELQAATYGPIVALLGVLAPGRTGDACAAAELINAYASGRPVGQEVANFLAEVASNIDLIAQRAENPEALRFAVSGGSGCPNQGRIYNFNGAWQRIDYSPLGQDPLVQELRCISKRMYHAVDARTNIAGTTLTAAFLPPVVEVFERSGGELSNLIQALTSGGNVYYAANAAKQSLLRF